MFSPMFNFKHTVTVFVADRDFKAVYRPVQNIRPDSSPMIRLSSIANNCKTLRAIYRSSILEC